MTTYHLDLSERADKHGERDVTIAALATEDKAVMAATLRAVADRLDPPQPVRPAYRSGLEIATRQERAEAEGDRTERQTARRGRRAAISLRAALKAWADAYWCKTDDLPRRDRELYDAWSRTIPLRDAQGLPNYAHDADCNTIHEAGPEPCPPPRVATPAAAHIARARRNLVIPDGCGPHHTFRDGCALHDDGKAP